MTFPRARSILEPGPVITRSAWPDVPVRSVHVIRIGGAGMSAVARLALEAGMAVTGSDSQDGQFIAPLREKGARISIGFDAASIAEDCDLVIVSTAVRADNPEVIEAHRRSIPVIHRAAGLAGLMGERRTVAVAGTHGKTSTTAMAVCALRGAGEAPAWAVGAAVPDLGANASLGADGELAVVEADESDGSFVAFRPVAMVVTNLEPDHLDFHGDEANLVAAFDAAVATIRPGGTLVVCADDPGARTLGERAAATGTIVQSYGAADTAQWRILEESAATTGTTARISTPHGEIALELIVHGHHNLLNAVGALAAASAAVPGADLADLAAGIGPFRGASRRFERKGEERGITVYDDNAHHPQEVRATITAAARIAGEGRVIAVFQPHLYSRTSAFAAEFAEALAAADQAIVMPVYGAREDPDPTVTAHTIGRFAQGDRLLALDDRAEVPSLVARLAEPGDVVLMLGAGDIVDDTATVLSSLADRPGGTA